MREKKGFLSKLVLVRKRDGGCQSAINVKELNKYVGSVSAFQKGRATLSEVHVPSWQLDVQARHEKCIFSGSFSQRFKKTDSFSMGRQSSRISLTVFGLGLAPRIFTNCYKFQCQYYEY